MKEQIEKAVKKHGKQKTHQALFVLGLVKDEFTTNGNCEAIPCDTGYYFNKTVCDCVLDVGKK
jgi:hypothetical protein